MLLKFLYDSLKPLDFILYFFFSSHFNLELPFFNRPLDKSSILFKPFLKTAISFSILCFQNGYFLLMVWSVLTLTFSHANNELALTRYLSSDKFLTGILFSTSLTSFTCLVTKVLSLLHWVGVSPFAPSCIISIRRWWMGLLIWSSGVSWR